MNGEAEILMLLSPLVYIAIIGLVIWLGFRFVIAIESIAQSLKKIAEKEK